jgi:hypothetical protein
MELSTGSPSERARAVVASRTGARQIALVGIGTSAHWRLLHAMMWGCAGSPPTAGGTQTPGAFKITGLHQGVGGFGTGVGFRGVFGTEITVRAAEFGSMSDQR